MICVELNIKFDRFWITICFCISNACGGVRSNGVGKNRETNEQHDEDCAEEGFQLARLKFDLMMEAGKLYGNCSVNN